MGDPQRLRRRFSAVPGQLAASGFSRRGRRSHRTPDRSLVGSIPLPDAETVFRTLAQTTGPYLQRLPDGETGIRKTWIRFLQQVLADNPAIEVATDVPPFKFTQWDGKLLREIPRLRVKSGAALDPATRRSKLTDRGPRRLSSTSRWGLSGSHQVATGD